VTSDARARPREEEAVQATQPPSGAEPTDMATTDGEPTVGSADGAAPDDTGAGKPGRRPVTGGGDDDARTHTRIRPALPLVPVLAVLLVLLLGATGYLWFTRPGTSAVRTADYVDVLQAARSGVVDLTSFDYLTLDDDIEQIRRVTTGDLQQESVDQLDQRRQQIADSEAVVNTEVVGAAVGAADDDSATVFAVIQSTQQSNASEQAQVQRYRIEVDLTRVGGRWLLSGITGR
jgi:Mce-associated membrane protein